MPKIPSTSHHEEEGQGPEAPGALDVRDDLTQSIKDMPEGLVKEFLLHMKRIMDSAALAYLQPKEQVEGFGHEFLPLPLMRHEAILWKAKIRPTLPRNEDRGFEGISIAFEEAQTLIEDHPRSVGLNTQDSKVSIKVQILLGWLVADIQAEIHIDHGSCSHICDDNLSCPIAIVACMRPCILKQFELDHEYMGNVEATGEDCNVEEIGDRYPFRALLDAGFVRTTTRNRAFGALKGALDGGLDIPHSYNRFASFSKDEKSLNANAHRRYILEVRVADYVKMLREDEPKKYQSQFSSFMKGGVEPENLKELYKSVHAAIRADLAIKQTENYVPIEKESFKMNKLTYEQRKFNLFS
ncbi:hypothetical protein L7F22_002929 [Adiantum nelumboides]|nr:hypothetical protein [Adiantum nelumboides]